MAEIYFERSIYMAKISPNYILKDYILSAPFLSKSCTKIADNHFKLGEGGQADFDLGVVSTKKAIFQIKFNKNSGTFLMSAMRILNSDKWMFDVRLDAEGTYTILFDFTKGVASILKDGKYNNNIVYQYRKPSSAANMNKWILYFYAPNSNIKIDKFSYATNLSNSADILYENKIFLKRNEVYGMSENTFTKLAEDWTVLSNIEKKSLFEATNYETASVDELATLRKFKVLNYSDIKEKPKLTVSAAPEGKLIFHREFAHIESFESINKATLTKTLSSNGICKLLVTDDMKKYKTYDFDTNTWEVVDHTDLKAVKLNGIDADKFSDIDSEGWDKLLKGKSGIGFAYLIEINNVGDQCAIDKMALEVDKKGVWEIA